MCRFQITEGVKLLFCRWMGRLFMGLIDLNVRNITREQVNQGNLRGTHSGSAATARTDSSN